MSDQPKQRKPPRPHFLVPATGTGGSTGTGYSTRPPRSLPAVADEPHVVERIRDACNLRDEPETDSEAVAAYAEISRRIDSIRRAREIMDIRELRKTMPVEQRVANIRHHAKRQHVDVSHELRVIEKMHERGKTGAATVRLEALEERLDHPPDERQLAA